MVVLNGDQCTRLPANGPESSPDITLSHDTLAMSTRWTVEKALSSDHLPILIDVATECKLASAPNRLFVNFQKALWNEFGDYVEGKVETFPLKISIRWNRRLEGY